MKVFTCNTFHGYSPVGASAVIVAETKTQAVNSLNKRLSMMGLKDSVTDDQLEEVDVTKRDVIILQDGDY